MCELRAIRVLEILKAHGMDMRPEAHTVLMPGESPEGLRNVPMNYMVYAIQFQCEPLVKWILDNCGLDVNIRLSVTTPSYLFISWNPRITQMLLEAGADPTVTNHHGMKASAVVRGVAIATADQSLTNEGAPVHMQVVRLLEQAEAEWTSRH